MATIPIGDITVEVSFAGSGATGPAGPAGADATNKGFVIERSFASHLSETPTTDVIIISSRAFTIDAFSAFTLEAGDRSNAEVTLYGDGTKLGNELLVDSTATFSFEGGPVGGYKRQVLTPETIFPGSVVHTSIRKLLTYGYGGDDVVGPVVLWLECTWV